MNATRYLGEVELSRVWKDKKINVVVAYFDLPSNESLYPIRKNRKWRIHPDWTYCHYIAGNQLNYTNKEEMLVEFLDKIQASDMNNTWAWGDRWGGKSGSYYVCELIKS